MGRTRNLPFLPTCGSPTKTLSFRASTTISGEVDDMFSTGDDVESVIRGLRSDRFFFDPGKTSSILEESKPKGKDKEKEKESVLPFKESVSMMEMESTDPFVDFKKSMQEMMEADEGLKQWDNLQELLSLYLAVNDKINHGYIIGAFIDLLLVNLGSSSKPASSSSSTINGQKQSLLMESGASNSNNNNKLMMMSSSDESPESGLSFTSSFASSSGICSSTSHFLSSCSLEDDDDDEEEEDDDHGGDKHGDDEDHNSSQKASVSDHPSCLKV